MTLNSTATKPKRFPFHFDWRRGLGSGLVISTIVTLYTYFWGALTYIPGNLVGGLAAGLLVGVSFR